MCWKSSACLYQTVVYGLNHYNKNVVLETSLSDIYTDIAVGAPFDGDGKVFIYRGSKSGIETKPAQVSLLWATAKKILKVKIRRSEWEKEMAWIKLSVLHPIRCWMAGTLMWDVLDILSQGVWISTTITTQMWQWARWTIQWFSSGEERFWLNTSENILMTVHLSKGWKHIINNLLKVFFFCPQDLVLSSMWRET